MEPIKTEYRRHLPHLQPLGGLFFVTFRLYGTIPATVMQAYKHENDSRVKILRQENSSDLGLQLYREEKRKFARFDAFLDKGLTDSLHLQRPQIARIVQDGMHFYDGSAYDLLAYCVMPNHVHLVVDFSQQLTGVSSDNPREYRQLYEILKTLKGYTARKCNEQLGKRSSFWQRESYDHLIRDARELANVIAYTLENSVKAGLVKCREEWPFSYCKS